MSQTLSGFSPETWVVGPLASGGCADPLWSVSGAALEFLDWSFQGLAKRRPPVATTWAVTPSVKTKSRPVPRVLPRCPMACAFVDAQSFVCQTPELGLHLFAEVVLPEPCYEACHSCITAR